MSFTASLTWHTDELPRYDGLYNVTFTNGVKRFTRMLHYNAKRKRWTLADGTVFPGRVLAWTETLSPYEGSAETEVSKSST